MTRILKELRLILAETMIGWALSVMPPGEDRDIFARHVDLYMRGARRRARK